MKVSYLSGLCPGFSPVCRVRHIGGPRWWWTPLLHQRPPRRGWGAPRSRSPSLTWFCWITTGPPPGVSAPLWAVPSCPAFRFCNIIKGSLSMQKKQPNFSLSRTIISGQKQNKLILAACYDFNQREKLQFSANRA